MVAIASDGIHVAIATNQGGVAAGHKTIKGMKSEIEYCISLFPPELQKTVRAFACPDFDGKQCYEIYQYGPLVFMENASHEDVAFRKGGAGMLRLAMKRYGLTDPKQCLMVGDRPEDEEAAKAAGMDFEWVQ